MFTNRESAGRQLAQKLNDFKGENAVVLAIPRGGVGVAAEIAKELDLPLGLIIPRKIGAPGNPELAIGAVAGEGDTFLNEGLIKTLGVTEDYLQSEILRQVAEIKRREEIYLQGHKQPDVHGKIAIVVDDGIATGSTAIAAVRAIKKQDPEKVVLAVPVTPSESKRLLEQEADELVVLDVPAEFYAVGQFYESFEQTTDEEVKELISDNRSANG